MNRAEALRALGRYHASTDWRGGFAPVRHVTIRPKGFAIQFAVFSSAGEHVPHEDVSELFEAIAYLINNPPPERKRARKRKPAR